jgi:hypothetical protein
MSSQSSYVHNEHPAGLGRIAIREADPMFYDDRMILQPVDSYSSGGSTVKRTIEPTVVKTPTVKQPVLQPEPIKKPAPVITTTSTPVVQPIITPTTSIPKTGGSHPIVDPKPDSGSEPSGETTPRNTFVKVEGDQLVINGNHRIGKKKAALVGGGLIGAAVLLKLVL